MKKILLLSTALLLACVSYGQLRLPAVYMDHMVLQQQSPVPIWGWAHPTQDITIHVSWDTTTIKTKSDNATFWAATLYTPVAGGPHSITIKAGGETRVLQDVLVGEVWLSSGQSNMEWSMAASGDGKLVMDQVNDPNIRLFQVPKSAASTEQVRGEGTWRVCDKESVRHFSAVSYFFAKKLNNELNIPIGIINASWGGTPAETWLPAQLIENNPALKASAEKQIDDKPWCTSKSGVVYNSMIRPLIPFRIAGALWYQGEANTVAPQTYKQLMEALILDWRKEFLNDFPFYYVQIAPWSGYGETSGVLIREQQTQMLSISKTGMVVVSDLVDDIKDIHPQFKKPVGERLANIALGDTYGKSGVVYKSPVYQSMKVEKNKIRLYFDNVPTTLISKGGAPTEFMIAGADSKFYPATAKIEGKTVVVFAKEVKTPQIVHFGWTNASMPNLFTQEGLPVPAFRTDRDMK